MDKFTGIIIEESLDDVNILKKVDTIDTKIEEVTENHNTPWIKKWTLHSIEILPENADEIAREISNSLDKEHPWYADFRNDLFHYIIFPNKVFKIDRSKEEEYSDVTKYGITIGIADYQLDFSPHIEEWNREK